MKARTRDRRVYLGSHPVLFAVLALTRRWPVLRLGNTVLVHDREAFVAALTRVPLDRNAEGTTGGAAGRLTGADMLFDQTGAAHRRTRRSTAESLGAAGVARLRPVWLEVIDRHLTPLRNGGEVDLVDLATGMSGATAAALLDLPVDGRTLAQAALSAGSTAARAHLPGLFRRSAHQAASTAAAHLTALVSPPAHPQPTHSQSAHPQPSHPQPGHPQPGHPQPGHAQPGLATMLAVAAINTSVAGLPRAAAWCADDNLWDWAATHPQALADELLRVTSPTPLLPRVAAASATLPLPGSGPDPGTDPHPSTPGFAIREGDRLLLVARHSVAAHRDDPDPADPAPTHIAQLVFGVGPHACPGARLARTQLADLLTALAPYRPVVVQARVDRRAALPGWSRLVVRAGQSHPQHSSSAGPGSPDTRANSADPAEPPGHR